jgi:HAD superfamily hydrolase (TIGR01544 family)
MIECGLTRADITDVINGSHLRLRSSVDQVLQKCRVSDIPVVIMSAGACGEAIPLFLEWQWVDFSNIHYACNQFIWDENGHAIGIHEPIIHTFNKDETSIERFPDIYNRIRNRPNVILIGDSLGDIGMVEWFPYRHLLKIGFLEGGDATSRAQYEAHFDVVIDGDGDFWFVKECLERILT